MNRDFTPEGQRIFDNLYKYDEMIRNGFNDKDEKILPSKPIKLTPEQKQIEFFKLELCKLINNSQMVIQDCQVQISQLDTVEEYIKCDAKVAITLHNKLIERLTRVLNGEPAFENEDHLTLNINKLKNFFSKLGTSR